MKRRAAALPLLIALLICVCVGPRAAFADPLVITGGQFTIVPLSPGGVVYTGELTISGERGFSLDAGVAFNDGVFGPALQCNQFQAPACLPGTAIDLGATFVGSGLRGQFTIDGQTFTNIHLANSTASAAAFFTGSGVAPEFGDGTATLVAPFLFEGIIRYPGGTDTLFGIGTAMLSLQVFGPSIGAAPRWVYAGAQYDFATVPEPATILFTGSGLALIARLRHRRRLSQPTGGCSV